MLNQTALDDVNSISSLRTWLRYQFVPGMLEQNTFAQTCDYCEFSYPALRGVPDDPFFTFPLLAACVRVSSDNDNFDIPHWFIRGITKTGSASGCEDPYYYLRRQHTFITGGDYDPITMRPGKGYKSNVDGQHKAACEIVSDTNTGSNGFYISSYHSGLNCFFNPGPFLSLLLPTACPAFSMHAFLHASIHSFNQVFTHPCGQTTVVPLSSSSAATATSS